MTPQIKQRIEHIRKGEVPDGYKKTKVGIVPAEWTVCNMGEIYSERKESGNPTLPILTVSIHSGVSDGELDEAELGKKVKRIEDKTKYLTARKGDLVFNMMRAWQGAVGVVRTDGLVSPAYIVANPNEKLYPTFMNEYMMLPSTINRLHKQSYGVTDFRLRLYWDSFIKIACCLPPLPEQEKIAEILTAQDRVIELCEKKVEQLKKLKKVFLQKMFPKPGTTVPEWRFPGFTDAWEQRKLSEYLVVSDEKNKDNLYSRNDVFSVSGDYGVVNQIEFQGRSFAGAALDNYGIVETGDVVYTKSPLNLTPYGIIKANKLKPGIVSVLYAVYHPHANCNPDFVQTYFEQNARLNNYLRPLISKGAKNTINVSDEAALNGDVVFPSVDEQNAISSLFARLDNLITLHQRKCDEEKQKKKALMQLLLTGIVRVKTAIEEVNTCK